MVAVPDAPSDYELIHRWQDERDEDAAEELLGRYKNLIRRYAGKFISPSLSFEDAFAIGLVGFAYALKKHKPDGDFQFSNTIVLYMRRELGQYYKRHSRLIKRSHIWRETPRQSGKPEDSPEDKHLLCLDHMVFDNGTVKEFVGELDGSYDWVEQKIMLEGLMNSRQLTQRERAVLWLRFGYDNSSAETARQLRCTRSAVRWATDNAFAKLRGQA